MLKTTISIIPVRNINADIEILMQKRMNNNVKDWNFTWEFPQGKLEKRPDLSIFNFVEYKLKSETGMILDSMLSSPGCWINSDNQSQSSIYIPLCIIPTEEELGIHFFVRGDGRPLNTTHAECHTWIKVKQLTHFVESNPICPLNKSALLIIQKLFQECILIGYLGG